MLDRYIVTMCQMSFILNLLVRIAGDVVRRCKVIKVACQNNTKQTFQGISVRPQRIFGPGLDLVAPSRLACTGLAYMNNTPLINTHTSSDKEKGQPELNAQA